VVHALDQYSAGARIKWPNDFLLLGRKIAGILVESVWTGDEVDCQVIGVGLNLLKDSVPESTALHFPATSLEQIGIVSPARDQIIHDILKEIIALREKISASEFISEWENHLAYRGDVVHIEHLDGTTQDGLLVGLESDGSLRLRDDHGNPVTIQFGDVSLRPPA
jgi:BirA family biotin operon repressor/biotin-[acetyl-CoA-carboxylase] ligase